MPVNGQNEFVMMIKKVFIKLRFPTKSIRIIEDVLLFMLLIFSFHYIYIAWAGINFWPFEVQVAQFFNWGSRLLFIQSKWVIDLFGIQYITNHQTFYITAIDGSPAWLEVAPGCTSLKQWLHWVFLMSLFPGPWKHKIWFIPVGILMSKHPIKPIL